MIMIFFQIEIFYPTKKKFQDHFFSEPRSQRICAFYIIRSQELDHWEKTKPKKKVDQTLGPTIFLYLFYIQNNLTILIYFIVIFFWYAVNVSEKFKGPSYPYYHKKFRPVTPISECYSDDMSCIYEAQSAYLRQK